MRQRCASAHSGDAMPRHLSASHTSRPRWSVSRGDSAAPLIQELKRLILAFDGLCQVLGGDLVEFDINPLGVDLESKRVWALDSKIVLASDEGDKHEPT